MSTRTAFSPFAVSITSVSPARWSEESDAADLRLVERERPSCFTTLSTSPDETISPWKAEPGVEEPIVCGAVTFTVMESVRTLSLVAGL